jgi:geranylgeranylglycerol-phosphate geranylgeranyltransferase
MFRLLGVLFRLSRPDASALLFFSVFLPMLSRSGSLQLSLESALPLYLVGVCIYVIDNLEDAQSDQVNHPDRPLPSGEISPPVVAVFYFICLALALISTRLFVDSGAFLYYSLLILGPNYQCVVDHLPNLKSAYVSIVTIVPILVLISHFPGDAGLRIVAVSLFLFTFGKELCMDFLDRQGDPASFLRAVTRQQIGIVSFSMQAAGLLCLAPLVQSSLELYSLLALVVLGFSGGYLWFIGRAGDTAVAVMKAQLAVGLIFLL